MQASGCAGNCIYARQLKQGIPLELLRLEQQARPWPSGKGLDGLPREVARIVRYLGRLTSLKISSDPVMKDVAYSAVADVW